MPDQKHIVVFSHGFGVRKDDRGLLSDIAASLPEAGSVLFDYFEVDEDAKTLTIRLLSEQAKMLNRVITEVRRDHPEAIIDIIAHSQGTIVAALAKPAGIRKTILLAPVFDMGIERTVKRYGSAIDLNGISKLPSVDGLTRLVPPEYWAGRATLKPFEEYNSFSKMTELIVIEAAEDEILSRVDLSPLDPSIKTMTLPGDHGFNGDARQGLKTTLKALLSLSSFTI